MKELLIANAIIFLSLCSNAVGQDTYRNNTPYLPTTVNLTDDYLVSCLQKDCGSNGMCDNSSGEAVCICEPWFFGEECGIKCDDVCPRSEFLTCVKDYNEPPEKNAYQCNCVDSTYEEIDPTDISIGCRNKDPCQEKDCGSNGTCDASSGKAVCICEPDFYGENCDIECDDVCPESKFLTCVKGNNSFECMCKDATYEPNDFNDITKGCTKKDPCQEKDCGSNGTCDASSGKAVCKCNFDFYGEECDIMCEDVCSPQMNLACAKDNTKPPEENAFLCECVDASYDQIDSNSISKGCKKKRNLNELIDCEFEKDFCNWKSINTSINENWQVINVTKNSSHYLPSLVFENYIYAQIYNHSQKEKNVKYTLQSPILYTSSINNNDDYLCFTFDYFMFGPNEGDLTLHLVDSQNTKSYTIWKKAKYSIDNWKNVSIPVGSYKTFRKFRLRFEAVISFGAVIAIKNFHYSKCLETDSLKKHLSCDFTFDTCGWFPETNNNTPSWKITSRKEAIVDHTSQTSDGGFAYIVNGQSSYLSHLYANNNSTQCLSFWYLTSDDENTILSVGIRQPQLKNYRNLWLRNGSTNSKWRRGQVEFTNETSLQLAFSADFKDSKQNSYIALDDIELTSGQCEQTGSCNFDDGFCGFNNDFNEWGNWMVGNGKSSEPNYILYPDTDANGNGRYAYIDYTYGILMPSHTSTKLTSEIIQCNNTKFCLAFSYAKYAESVASLQVLKREFKSAENNEITLWKSPPTDSSQYTNWQRANVIIDCVNDFEITFTTRDVRCVTTFIAIDAVSINPGSTCKELDKKLTPDVIKFTCNFETTKSCSFFNFVQWIVSYGLDSSADGPTLDSNTKTKTGYYLVADNVLEARMTTKHTIKNNQPVCLQFWFNSFGTELNSLQIILQTNDVDEKVFWNRTISKEDEWHPNQVEIRNYDNYNIIIQSQISKYNSSRAYIAVDDIVLTMDSCPGSCSFENGMCGITHKVSTYISWVLTGIVKPGHFPLDHSTQTKHGNYLYINSLNVPTYYTGSTTLQSPKIPAGKYCLKFWYYPTAYCYTVTIRIISNAVCSDQQILSQAFTSSVRNGWVMAQLNITTLTYFQVNFEVQVAYTGRTEFAIGLDDIQLSSNACV